MKLVGIVRSGIGDLGQWIAKLADRYENKTGMRLFPGTLNIHLKEEYQVPGSCTRLEARAYGGRVSVSLVPCRIFGRRAFILRTDVNAEGRGHYPRSVIEVAGAVKQMKFVKLQTDGLRCSVRE